MNKLAFFLIFFVPFAIGQANKRFVFKGKEVTSEQECMGLAYNEQQKADTFTKRLGLLGRIRVIPHFYFEKRSGFSTNSSGWGTYVDSYDYNVGMCALGYRVEDENLRYEVIEIQVKNEDDLKEALVLMRRMEDFFVVDYQYIKEGPALKRRRYYEVTVLSQKE